MDQSKWCLPRVKHGVLTKAMQKMDRPRIKLQGVWAHGIALCLYPIDVRQPADGTLVVESICKTLEYCATVLRRSGVGFPKRVIIWELWMQISSIIIFLPCVLFDFGVLGWVCSDGVRLIIPWGNRRTRLCWRCFRIFFFRRAWNSVEYASTELDTHIVLWVFWPNIQWFSLFATHGEWKPYLVQTCSNIMKLFVFFPSPLD